MGRNIRTLLIVVVLAPLIGGAQAQEKQPTGTVTGHVYCADTNAPARMANVVLQPVKAAVAEANSAKTPAQEPGPPTQGPVMAVVQTSLNGSFSIPRVAPGSYYVVVEKQGYISPITEFSSDEIDKPTPEIAARVAKVMQRVTVDAGQATLVEERIERGAAVSGTVSFDDGSPAAGLRLGLLLKNGKGEWEDVGNRSAILFAANRTTDDQGHFRIAGLRPGEYLLQANLEIVDTRIQKEGGGFSVWSGNPKISIAFYSGSTTRRKDGTSFKLIAGDERDGEDIVIPLLKMHRIAGTLVAAHDGHVVTAAQVSLLYADDRSALATVRLGQNDAGFDFQFVPEGDYILQVSDAHDAVWEEGPKPPAGMVDLGLPIDKPTQWYGETEQPISAHEDSTGLVVSVPEKAEKPAVAAGGANSTQ